MPDVAWWDCISDYWQMTQIQGLRGMDVEMFNRAGHKWEGTYLWTVTHKDQRDVNDHGQSECWHEHKNKTYFLTITMVCYVVVQISR